MCRLAYVPFETQAEDKSVVATLFEFLELSFGGHGNGIGYFSDMKPFIHKGSKLSTVELADFMVDNGTSAIFHTRLASMGSICDANCHPFSYNGVLTAHNGHWGDAREMARMLIHADKFQEKKMLDMTDSEVIACLVGNYGFGSTSIVDTGVILSLYHDHAKVFVKGDFEYIKTPQGRYFYASEFPRKIIDGMDVEEYWMFGRGSIAKLTMDGPILTTGKLTKTVPSAWPTYNRGVSIYGYDYDRFGTEWGSLVDYPFDGGFRQVQPPVPKVTEKVSFLPKQKGKKAKKRPYRAIDIVRNVSSYIGFDEIPEVEALEDTTIHSELACCIDELQDELERIVGTRPYNKHNRAWLAEEINEACLSWLAINATLINEYEFIKEQYEEAFLGDELDGDMYVDSYENRWFFLRGEWKLESDLDDEEVDFINNKGDGKWEALL